MLSIIICTDIKISEEYKLSIDWNTNEVSLTLVKDEPESMKWFSYWKMLIDSQRLVAYSHFYLHREFRYHSLRMMDHHTMHKSNDESSQLLTK